MNLLQNQKLVEEIHELKLKNHKLVEHNQLLKSEIDKQTDQIKERELSISSHEKSLKTISDSFDEIASHFEKLKRRKKRLIRSTKWKIGKFLVFALNRITFKQMINQGAMLNEQVSVMKKSLEDHQRLLKTIELKKSALSGELSIDVIVPVHNAVEDFRNCILSLIHSQVNDFFNIIIVNDGSDKETSDFIECFRNYSGLTIKHNKERKGYTKSINIGLKSSKGDVTIILNSDTIVPPDWIPTLRKSIDTIGNDFGVIGPLSNAASYQSVPETRDLNGDWMVNSCPKDKSLLEINRLIKGLSFEPNYLEAPIVNGFCFIISNDLRNSIGPFDEIGFPEGYGEENDYCIRALKAGYKNYILTDLYVYHAKSKSFGHNERRSLSKMGSSKLKDKWGKKTIKNHVKSLESNVRLVNLRDRIRDCFSTFDKADKLCKKDPLKIMFILPSKGGGGGAHSVMQEAQGLRALGVFVQIVNNIKYKKRFESTYEDIISRNRNLVYYYDSEEDLFQYAKAMNFDFSIATIFTSTRTVQSLNEKTGIKPAYYIQDYEPLFCKPNTEKWSEALASYTLIDDMIMFAKTQWIQKMVMDKHNVVVHKVSPSLDSSIYFSPEISHKNNSSFCAMIRPATPRRGAERTMKLLLAIADLFPQITINIFGCEVDDPFFEDYNLTSQVKNFGILTRSQVSDILKSSTFFIDLSDYQAFGRTGLESMACGCIPILPKEGGVEEYATHESNSLIVDVHDQKSILELLTNLIFDQSRIEQMRIQGISDSKKFSIEAASLSILQVLQKNVGKI